MASRSRVSKVFFPWERRRGLFGALGRARVRFATAIVIGIVLIVVLRTREERASGVRATRATLTVAHRAVVAYRADHEGACPKALAELVVLGYTAEVPTDAWGSAVRLSCPGRKDPLGFDLVSDGPDGLPFGLDRVE